MNDIRLTPRELRYWMVRLAGLAQVCDEGFLADEVEMLKRVIRDHYDPKEYYRGRPVSVPRTLRRHFGRYIGVRDKARTAQLLANLKGIQIISGEHFCKSVPI